MPGIEVGTLGDIWLHYKHTRTHPTDAYGTIEFQGGPHPTKAQVWKYVQIFEWKIIVNTFNVIIYMIMLLMF